MNLRYSTVSGAALFAAASLMTVSTPASASVICADGTVHTALNTGFGPSASLGPGLAGCSSGTMISLTGGALWKWTGNAVAMGGDRVDWSKSWVNGFGYGSVSLDPNNLVVTPVASVAAISLSVSTSDVTSTSLDYSITWSGDNAGTAQYFAWYAYDGTSTGFTGGDNTLLPNWSTNSILLATDTEHGPWSQTLTGTLTFPAGDDVILAVNGVAATLVPEPATWTMMLMGFAGLGYAAYRRQYVTRGEAASGKARRASL